ncbi:MAG TPA: carboxypeptidase-like regulatory domain-containing protein, partial [Pseudobacter sp.]|nr:carboxypeptidase-like regulatory domain-containing protein [Pseudobacter sp.]
MNFKQLLFVLSLLLSIQSFAQHASVHGKVTAANGQPVSSISVTLLNTRWGTTTNDNGEYNIRNIKPGTYTIQLSYTGDIRKTQSITLAADSKTELDFTIEHAARQLEEVIVETNKIMNRAGATANKLNLSAMETPQIVNTISNVTLRKQNAMTLEDAMKNAVGMTKLWDATSRPDGGSFFVSRGFQTVTKARNGLPNIVNTNVDLANLEA